MRRGARHDDPYARAEPQRARGREPGGRAARRVRVDHCIWMQRVRGAGATWLDAAATSPRLTSIRWPRRGSGVVEARMAGGAVERYAAESRIPFRGDAVQ